MPNRQASIAKYWTRQLLRYEKEYPCHHGNNGDDDDSILRLRLTQAG